MAKRERIITIRPFRNQAGILAVILDEVLATLRGEDVGSVRLKRVLIEPESNTLVANCIIVTARTGKESGRP